MQRQLLRQQGDRVEVDGLAAQVQQRHAHVQGCHRRKVPGEHQPVPHECLRKRHPAPAGALLRLRDLVVVELAALAQHLRERRRTAHEGGRLLFERDRLDRREQLGWAGDRLVRLEIDGV